MNRSKEKGIDNPYIGLLLAEDHIVIRSQCSPQSSEAKGFNFVLEDECYAGSSLDGEPPSTNSLDFSPTPKRSASESSLPASQSWQHTIHEGFLNAGLLSSSASRIRIGSGSRFDAVMDRFYSAMGHAWDQFLQEQGFDLAVTISWPLVYHSLLVSTEPLTPALFHSYFQVCAHETRRYGEKHTLFKLAMAHREFLYQYKDDPQSCLVGHIPSIDFFTQAGLIHPGSDITAAIGFPKLSMLQIDVPRSISPTIGALVVVCTTLSRGIPIDLTTFPSDISIESFRFCRVIESSSSSYAVSLDPMKLGSQLEVTSNAMITISSSIRATIGTC